MNYFLPALIAVAVVLLFWRLKTKSPVGTGYRSEPEKDEDQGQGEQKRTSVTSVLKPVTWRVANFFTWPGRASIKSRLYVAATFLTLVALYWYPIEADNKWQLALLAVLGTTVLCVSLPASARNALIITLLALGVLYNFARIKGCGGRKEPVVLSAEDSWFKQELAHCHPPNTKEFEAFVERYWRAHPEQPPINWHVSMNRGDTWGPFRVFGPYNIAPPGMNTYVTIWKRHEDGSDEILFDDHLGSKKLLPSGQYMKVTAKDYGEKILTVCGQLAAGNCREHVDLHALCS